MATVAISPAKKLLGKTLPKGWRVVQSIPKRAYSSGGTFSDGYIVESSEGKRAFMKAVDLASCADEPDPLAAINLLTTTFGFERELLEACKSRRLSRIVTAIDHGQIGATPNELVFYLIFELADGDVRGKLGIFRSVESAWNLRVLHHVSIALQQLHSQSIAHQDIKPSNVLLYNTSGSKVADLGRASRRGAVPLWDDFDVAGDYGYAPPELLYGWLDSDWNRRHLGCDLYLLGSLILSLFTGFGMTTLTLQRLEPSLRPGVWTGSYSDVLPFIVNAQADVTRDFRDFLDAVSCKDQLCRIMTELCHPDPLRRGHPSNQKRTANPLSLERYTTEFDLIARRLETTSLG